MTCLPLSVDYVLHNTSSHPQKRLCVRDQVACQGQTLSSGRGQHLQPPQALSQDEWVQLLPVVTGPQVSQGSTPHTFIFAHLNEKAATTCPHPVEVQMKAQVGKGSHKGSVSDQRVERVEPGSELQHGVCPLGSTMVICPMQRSFPFGTFFSFLSKDILTGAAVSVAKCLPPKPRGPGV